MSTQKITIKLIQTTVCLIFIIPVSVFIGVGVLVGGLANIVDIWVGD